MARAAVHLRHKNRLATKEKRVTKTIALFASSRRDGNTGQLIDSIMQKAKMEFVDLTTRDITPYDYAHKNIGDDFLPLMDEILRHDKIIFVTPVYWYGPSAQMKVFIDRLSDLLDVEHLKDKGRALRAKTAFIACTSISADADDVFLGGFKNTFEYMGMNFGGYIHAQCQEDFAPAHHADQIGAFIAKITTE